MSPPRPRALACASVLLAAALSACSGTGIATRAAPEWPTLSPQRVTIKHDRFDDQFRVFGRWVRPTRMRRGTGFVEVLPSTTGAGPIVKPQTVFLAFSRDADEWQWLHAHQVDILVDGVKLEHDGLRLDTRLQAPGVIEVVFVAVSKAVAMKIAQSEVAEFRVGTMELRFVHNLQSALREVLATAGRDSRGSDG